MKIWYHVIAAVVGISLAGLIVFLVFGNASRQAATQDGAAPGSLDASGGSLCGSIPPAQGATPAARKQGLAHLPTIVSPTGQQVSINTSTLDGRAQLAWVARVQAASGLCIDELRIGDKGGRNVITMSTVSTVTPVEAAAYAGAVVTAAYTLPLRRTELLVTTFVGDQRRRVFITDRAYNAFQVYRRSNRAGTSVADLRAFRRQVGPGFGAANLRIQGWG